MQILIFYSVFKQSCTYIERQVMLSNFFFQFHGQQWNKRTKKLREYYENQYDTNQLTLISKC